MNSAVTKKEANYITVADYLEYYCQEDGERYELINGEVWAMGSTSKAHNLLASNLLMQLKTHLKGKPCKAYMECLKVYIKDNFYFPDVAVDCGEETENDDNYSLKAPTLLVEVLSNSTRRYDRIFKLGEYQKIPTLLEYLLIEQEFKEVTLFRHRNHWRGEIFYEGDDILFESVNLTVAVNDIYDDVTLPAFDGRKSL